MVSIELIELILRILVGKISHLLDGNNSHHDLLELSINTLNKQSSIESSSPRKLVRLRFLSIQQRLFCLSE